MFNSVSSLHPVKKNVVINALGPIVIDLMALSLVAKKAHVNVRGPYFVALHGLFSDLYESASDHADKLAEYCEVLGSPVAIDHKDVGASSVSGLPKETTDGLALVPLVESTISAVVAKVDAAARVVSVDENARQLLIDVSLALGKLGWMIGAHVPKELSGG